MARTAHTARKEVASGSKTGSKTKGVAEKRLTKSMSVRTPHISQVVKPKRARHGGAGTVLKEIKYYQTNIGFLIPRAGIVRLIRGIAQETLKNHTAQGLRFTSASLSILHEAIENHLVCLVELSYMAARHAKRVTLFASDIRLINRIKRHGK